MYLDKEEKQKIFKDHGRLKKTMILVQLNHK